MSDPGLEIRGGPGHPDPEIVGVGVGAGFGLSVWAKNKGRGSAPLLDAPLPL